MRPGYKRGPATDPRIVIKQQEPAYRLDNVLSEHIPKLRHGNDGLIFTCLESAYKPGTDVNMWVGCRQRVPPPHLSRDDVDPSLKWKAAWDISVDFKLELRFPPIETDLPSPDLNAKPTFVLLSWLGQGNHTYFAEMLVSDEDWNAMKETGEEFDDRIVECTWDVRWQTWSLVRFRDDKPHANHDDIVREIVASIQDGVRDSQVRCPFPLSFKVQFIMLTVACRT